jgi:hypothetical protein
MAIHWRAVKPFLELTARAWSALRERPALRISARPYHRPQPGSTKIILVIDFKIKNRGRRPIQINRWGVSTTKARVGFSQVFELNGLLLAENTAYEITEQIDDDIAKALPTGAELFCETATGEMLTARLKIAAFPSAKPLRN